MGLTTAVQQPMWGCGLLGPIPGISADGSTTAEAAKMISGLQKTSTFNKVSFWNWNLATMRNDDGTMQYLSKDFIFMPEQWGIQAVTATDVRQAGVANFKDVEGGVCPATMSYLFLGANEPDIIGSCMGSMMGRCTGSCTAAEVASGCPVSHLHVKTPANPLPNGHCDCWTDSHATGCGYWPIAGCSGLQPLPTLFKDSVCVAPVMAAWKQTAASIVAKGYKYLSTPLIAVNMDWMESFVDVACTGCSDISCGCPSHVSWHFYASDCRPVELGGYKGFQNKLNRTRQLMEKYPHLQGAIVNEVGMLNCYQDGDDPECIPNGPKQKYPAISQPNHACPNTTELPDGLVTFASTLIDMVAKTPKTTDGRSVVAGFSWFNEDMDGGTYNLRVFNSDGSVNRLGDAYIAACQKWASSWNM